MQKKNQIIIFSLIILIIVSTIGFFSFKKIQSINLRNQTAQVGNVIENKTVPQIKPTTLFFVGDMMLTRGVKSSVMKNFGGDYNKLFENLAPLKDADILFANLEGDVSDVGNNVGSKYSFRMDTEVLSAIKNAGFDIVLFANNHVGDWNISAFKDTLARLNENEILKTGAGVNKADAEDPTIIEKNGTKFGFLGFTDVGPNWLEAKTNNPGILLASDPNFENIIKNAKTKCDVLIVSFHFGVEYKLVHNQRQEFLAHTAIDNGADMIIGTHPHVMEDIENYKGKTIVYSLGNFIFDLFESWRILIHKRVWISFSFFRNTKSSIRPPAFFNPVIMLKSKCIVGAYCFAVAACQAYFSEIFRSAAGKFRLVIAAGDASFRFAGYLAGCKTSINRIADAFKSLKKFRSYCTITFSIFIVV